MEHRQTLPERTTRPCQPLTVEKILCLPPQERPTRYIRLSNLSGELNRARMAADGSYYRAMDRFKSVKLPIIDDFLATPIETVNSVDLFEILEAREGRRATLIASQLEPNEWHLRIEGELIADSILGRVASACRYLDIDGPNMRKWLAEDRPRDE